MGPVTKSDFVKRQIKIFSIGLQKMNPEIIPDSPVKYVRNFIFSLIIEVLPTTFNYSEYVLESTVDSYLKKIKIFIHDSDHQNNWIFILILKS